MSQFDQDGFDHYGHNKQLFFLSSLSVMQVTLLIGVQIMILQVDFLTASQQFIGSGQNIRLSVSFRTAHIKTATSVTTMESIPAGIRLVL